MTIWSLTKKQLITLQVTLFTEADIPETSLEAPLDNQNVAALCWWLLCHGITPSSSARKAQLITKYLNITLDIDGL